jgi:hypothetical protein
VLFIDTSDSVNQTLDRAQDWIQKSLFAIKHTRHESAEWFGDGKEQQNKDSDLKPSVCSHVRISPA